MAEQAETRPAERSGTLEEAQDLLNTELPDPRFVDGAYLEWLYHQNPYGDAITGFRRSESGDRLDGHYALIPQRYRTPEAQIPFMFSLNAVSRSGSQRRGTFVSLTRELFARAAEAGFVGALGVTNDNSTRAVKRTDFRYLGPMPVIVRPHRGSVGKTGSAWTHTRISEATLTTELLDRALEDVDCTPRRGIANDWNADYLKWRLQAPHNRGYVLHEHPDVVAISTVHRAGPLPVAVLLKLLPRGAATERAPINANFVMEAIAGFHRAPAALYAGFNESAKITGYHPPRRLLPAPLNLNYVPFNGAIPTTGLHVATYEFLDCDAY